jgi:4-alpha-glucanotransferase
MTKKTLDQLAEACGIELTYLGADGKQWRASETATQSILAALDVKPSGDPDAMALVAACAEEPRRVQLVQQERSFVPGWLADGRTWGATCQLYALRSNRNLGIGDFEDLARLAEILAQSGADFIGVNPLHALFLSAPERCSPYSPSSRRFLNPLYLALDRISWAVAAMRDVPGEIAACLRELPQVDYTGVARLKQQILYRAFVEFCATEIKRGTHAAQSYFAWRAKSGAALENFALFEALSASMVASGGFSGWVHWPKDLRSPSSVRVQGFATENAANVDFHAWLQWLAAVQLEGVQQRARLRMRIGLYLDLAVGDAPDGATTWADPELVVPTVSIGAPPDYFNERGQNWGLAPISPHRLMQRAFVPFAEMLVSLMHAAGAIRIDHAMSVQRLFWIPDGCEPRDGAYVRYPVNEMLACLARISQGARTLVIGEDLGTLPPGFRELMSSAALHGYRIFFFSRGLGDRFAAPATYPRDALACVSTHDLPTLRGWWLGRDIGLRVETGTSSSEAVERMRTDRIRDRRMMLDALLEAGLLPRKLAGELPSDQALPTQLTEELVNAVHVFIARTPCRLVSVQLEDLAGELDQVNLPGSQTEYPNWRRKLAVSIEDLPSLTSFQEITRALAAERPRCS